MKIIIPTVIVRLRIFPKFSLLNIFNFPKVPVVKSRTPPVAGSYSTKSHVNVFDCARKSSDWMATQGCVRMSRPKVIVSM